MKRAPHGLGSTYVDECLGGCEFDYLLWRAVAQRRGDDVSDLWHPSRQKLQAQALFELADKHLACREWAVEVVAYCMGVHRSTIYRWLQDVRDWSGEVFEEHRRALECARRELGQDDVGALHPAARTEIVGHHINNMVAV